MSDSYVTKRKKDQQNVEVLLLLYPFLLMCTHGTSITRLYATFQIVNITAYSTKFFLILGVYVSNHLTLLYTIFSQIDSITIIYKENTE